MALTREERKLLHQKSQQPTFGSGKPDSRDGNDGDISFRKVEGSGTVQYLKENNDWTAISSTGEMPAIRIAGGGSSGGSGGVSNHASLSGLESDDHDIYLLIDGSRAMTSVMIIGADSDGTDRSITWGHSTLKTIMGIDDSSDAFVINTDDAFDATLANNSFSIDASHNAIIAGNLTIVGGDITLANGSTIDSSASAGTLLLTEDIVKSSASLQSTTTMTVGTDLTVTGGDIILGAVATSGTMTVVDSAASTAGNTLIIGGSDVTAGGGGTANVQGGSVTIKAGTSTGTATSGSIIFQTAPAGSASGTAASDESLATVLTIAGDASSTFKGAVYVHDGSNNIFYLDPALVRFYMYDDADVANYMYLQVLTNGVTKLHTVDGGGTAADFYIDADGDIYLDAVGEKIYFQDNGVTRMLFNIDTTPELDVTGDFTIDGSADITLDAVGAFLINGGSTITSASTTDFIVETRGAQRMFVDDDGHIFLHSYAQDLNNNNYGINNKKDLYHFTTGNGDFNQNYTIISEYEVLSAGQFEAYPS